MDNSNKFLTVCTDDQQKELQKEVKRNFKEMKQMTSASYQKFLSVYRMKTTLTKQEKIEMIKSTSNTFDDVQNAYKFQTSMHYYKRDHSPIGEGMTSSNKLYIPFERSPYAANLAEYEGNIVTQSFKDNMLQ